MRRRNLRFKRHLYRNNTQDIYFYNKYKIEKTFESLFANFFFIFLNRLLSFILYNKST